MALLVLSILGEEAGGSGRWESPAPSLFFCCRAKESIALRPTLGLLSGKTHNAQTDRTHVGSDFWNQHLRTVDCHLLLAAWRTREFTVEVRAVFSLGGFPITASLKRPHGVGEHTS
jgi:hypothetical protein